MRMASFLVAFLVLGATIVTQGAARKVDFTDDAVGQPPKGFEFGHTAKTGAPGNGSSRQKRATNTSPNSMRTPRARAFLSRSWPTSPRRTSRCPCDSNRYLAKSTRPQVSSGGIENENNYYIVRANALEDNVVLYKVENGKRTDLPRERGGPHVRQEG